ncbi:MAG TPA: SDR family NAD(P)-dependent oxidoreductase [Dietzia timorensis]|uniref:SDR family NAD(P)-dependent oxidoreductase n=1 Tax=Dietzia timorensis TaxID=499555 RepID=A0A921F122_9ACTN|nr:SDR family NAD(P)-dependent oxidoreductase [Dietzia timorensis]HJE89816.1 SDR family NAD(P)-dependent oxidoreductase [Dietzia timorensis]
MNAAELSTPGESTHHSPAGQRIALVTGGSRGVGKGVARALADAGWTVYVTGRSAERLADTIAGHEDSIFPIEVDHADDARVEAAFDEIRTRSGRLDLLVNNVWTNPEGFMGFGSKFWERPVDDWDPLIGIGLRAHYVASVEAAKIMVPQGSGQILHISSFGSRAPFHTVLYGMSKTALDKMAADMAHDLRDTGVRCNSLWLGLIRTELLLSFGMEEFNGFPLGRAEDPEFVGRVIAALTGDPEIRSGDTVITAEYGRDHGIVNNDGAQPLSHRGAFGGGPLFPPVTDAQLGLDTPDEVAEHTGKSGAADNVAGH